MSITVEEVFETVKMTLHHHFDIRTVTLGINLKDCIDSNINKSIRKMQKKIIEKGILLNKCSDIVEQKYGIPITNRRIAVTPVSILLEPLPHTIPTAVKMAKALDAAAQKTNIDFIGGFGAMVQKGTTKAEENLINSIPQAIASTKRLCGFLNLASTRCGINMNVVARFGHILKDLAKKNQKRHRLCKDSCLRQRPRG